MTVPAWAGGSHCEHGHPVTQQPVASRPWKLRAWLQANQTPRRTTT